MKIQEELSALKNEFESLNKKLAELNDEDLEQVSGGLPYLVIKLPEISSDDRG